MELNLKIPQHLVEYLKERQEQEGGTFEENIVDCIWFAWQQYCRDKEEEKI